MSRPFSVLVYDLAKGRGERLGFSAPSESLGGSGLAAALYGKYGLPGEDVFAVAGLWRPTAEWGDCYTVVMVDGHPQMAEVHDRMPLILSRAAQRYWLEGTADDALALCQTWEDAISVERTDQRWAGGAPVPGQAGLPL